MEEFLYYCAIMYFLAILFHFFQEDGDKTISATEWLFLLTAPISIPLSIIWAFISAIFD